MRSDRREDDNDWVKGCVSLIRALLQLIVLLIPLIRACTLLPPDELKNLVGVEVHQDASENLVTWYCQDDRQLSDCTSNKIRVVAENLPPVVGVASRDDGALVLLYQVESGEYRLGEITGPLTQTVTIPTNAQVIDIATRGKGDQMVGLCEVDHHYSDCIGHPPVELKELNDQVPIGLTWGDDESDVPQIWCREIKDGKMTAERCP